jgi:putative copper export protein
MQSWLIAARAAHFFSLALLVGGGGLLYAAKAGDMAVGRACLRLAAVSNALSAVAWLGMTLVEVTDDSSSLLNATDWRAFFASPFGPVWAVQIALSVAPLLPGPLGRAGLAALLGSACAIEQAWLGHTAAATGLRGAVMIASYATHVLAGLGWVGALTMLGVALRSWPSVRAPLEIFSRVGPWMVVAILASGSLNAVFHLGRIEDLAATSYGRVVTIKAALVAIMLIAAAFNRRLRRADRATSALTLGVGIETALGIAVLWAAAALGVTAPAA